MNKIFLALILSSVFLSMSSTLFSATVEKSPVLKIQGSKEMPLELNLIIQSLQENIPENQIEVNNLKHFFIFNSLNLTEFFLHFLKKNKTHLFNYHYQFNLKQTLFFYFKL